MNIADIYIKNGESLMAKVRPQIAAIEQLIKGGYLDEVEVCVLIGRIGEYISSHIELEYRPKITPIPKVFEDAFSGDNDH